MRPLFTNRREDVFSETELPALPIIGNSWDKREAGIQPRPSSYVEGSFPVLKPRGCAKTGGGEIDWK
jgi:hypothetical protein